MSCHYEFTDLKYYNLFFLISYQEEFQPVKYFLSKISISPIIMLKNCKIWFLSLFFNFAFKTKFGRVWERNFKFEFYGWPPKSGCLFGWFAVEQVLKSFTCSSNSRVATLPGMLEIVRNFRNFARKSGKCQENWLILSNVRKMSEIFYDVLSGGIPYFMFSCLMWKKELNVK